MSGTTRIAVRDLQPGMEVRRIYKRGIGEGVIEDMVRTRLPWRVRFRRSDGVLFDYSTKPASVHFELIRAPAWDWNRK